MSQREIKAKNLWAVYGLMFLTFGIYGLVWSVKSKRDMNALGAEIPTSWLLLVPIANIYWLYKYCEGFANHVAKDDGALKWFLVSFFIGFVTPYIVQSKLNEYAQQGGQHKAQLAAAA